MIKTSTKLVCSALLLVSAVSLQPASAAIIKSSHWLNNFEMLMPKMLCEHKTIAATMARVNIGQSQCIKLAQRAVKTCVDQYRSKLPNEFNTQTDMSMIKNYGREIGRCSGRELWHNVQAVKQKKEGYYHGGRRE